MREHPTEKIERYRVAGEPGDNNGKFVWTSPKGIQFQAIASNGAGWDHVSLSVFFDPRTSQGRGPTWEEICWIKDQFWQPEETVIQFHPKKSQYVNFHPYVLHLWKPQLREISLPPSILVAPRVRSICES